MVSFALSDLLEGRDVEIGTDAIWPAIWVGILSNAGWALITLAGRQVLVRFGATNTRIRRTRTVLLLVAAAIVFLVSLLVIRRFEVPETWQWALFAAALAWSLLISLLELNRYWTAGLSGADGEIRRGLDYEAALRMVRRELSFLGTGADKLSRTAEFSRAMHRCRSDVPIRLLLRRPTDPTLAAAASRAHKVPDEYRNNVIESLRRLANQKRSLDNLQVRFYEGDLAFRIMLIDGNLALVSFNSYGRGDGSELPQLHFEDDSDRRETSSSFYQVWEKYFNDKWVEAEPWDFKEHL